jgi:hypothetical protein
LNRSEENHSRRISIFLRFHTARVIRDRLTLSFIRAASPFGETAVCRFPASRSARYFA